VTAVRRTQTERSEATQAALAEAAIDVLLERGWASVTAVEVCQRVGVTRGAFHHHYESMSQLLADALSQLYADMVQTRPEPAANLVTLIDRTWTAISNPRFKAVIEAWLAMANDPNLAREIGPVVAEFASLVSPVASPATVLSNVDASEFYLFAREAMLGLALGRATTRSANRDDRERIVLDRLRTEAAALDRSAARDRPSHTTNTKPTTKPTTTASRKQATS
jgi:AcrR family transcriptional regulator